jgi:hypothetical protein
MTAVRIPIPPKMNGDIHAYWYDVKSGTLTDMNARQENGYLSFKTSNFGYYAVASINTARPSIINQLTGGGYLLYSLIILIFAGVGVVILAGKRKKSQSNN